MSPTRSGSASSRLDRRGVVCVCACGGVCMSAGPRTISRTSSMIVVRPLTGMPRGSGVKSWATATGPAGPNRRQTRKSPLWRAATPSPWRREMSGTFRRLGGDAVQSVGGCTEGGLNSDGEANEILVFALGPIDQSWTRRGPQQKASTLLLPAFGRSTAARTSWNWFKTPSK